MSAKKDYFNKKTKLNNKVNYFVINLVVLCTRYVCNDIYMSYTQPYKYIPP
jgi:hypothetical protein